MFLRMLSCYLSWYLKQALAPILCHDHDEAAAGAQGRNPVVAAQRFNPALAKASRKRTADRYPGAASPGCSPTWPPSAPTMFSPPTTCQRSP